VVHPLLIRQLKKVGGSIELPPADGENWQQLLERISQFYANAEQERYLLERALNVSSAEMEALSSRLAEERDTLTAILRSLGDGVSALDEEGRVVLLNPEAERLLGWRESDLAGQHLLPLIWPAGVSGRGSISLRELVGAGDAHRDEEGVIARSDGTPLTVSYVLTPLVREDALAGAVLVFRDMTERKRARDAETQLIRSEAARAEALASERRLHSLIQNATDLIVILDAESRISYASPAAEHVWGFRSADLLQTPIANLIHEDDRLTAGGILDEAHRRAGATLNVELRLRDARNDWRDCEVTVTNRLEQAGVDGIVLTCHDITDRKAYEQQLRRLAFRDSLTGLANRALLLDRLERALQGSHRLERPVAVVFLDLDNFKVVNDSLGHAQGDELLVEVARRLSACVREGDTAARLGGDEFTLLLEDATEADAVRVAERVVDVLSSQIQLGERSVVVSTSLGVAVSAANGEERPESLLRKADLAMYQAKAGGKARWVIFDPSMEARALQRLELETDLREAQGHDQFRLVYQPILSLNDRRVIEVEALLRWRHPRRGMVSPAEFVPVAEETGLIEALGQWVLEQACRQVRLWHDRFPAAPPLVMSVNLSARQLQQPHLVDLVASIMRDTGVDPTTIKLEITESAIMQDPEVASRTLSGLRALGVRLAVDDFGTGYSSLSYLKRFPVDTLKIDRSFVDGVGRDTHDTAIVRSVIELARTLGLTVTAEGIETPMQESCLQRLGCDRGQGYLFAKPLPPAEVEVMFAGSVQQPLAA
jgi:diguanylate cyclase (GGDEF)-like protein/PAS domain S-box-containing protein